MPEFKGAIFDLDGTLASTANAHKKAWLESLKIVGINVNNIDTATLLGKRALDIAILLIEKSDKGKIGNRYELAKKLLQTKMKVFEPYIRQYAKPMPCALDLVNTLRKKKLKIIIITSSLKVTAIKTLETIGIEPDVLVAGDELEKGKPNPDPVILGLKKANINKDEVMFAVGDTIYDVQAFGESGIKRIYLTKSDIAVPVDEYVLKKYGAIRIESLCDILRNI
ncbi:MAG: HAD family phosphatase [Caldisphaeraceae archaeon]|nr:HAD family phosphatase [Caldisphaeraceae archaeon]MEB2793837.1 HAD family phosphatase [Caldisphaeraceae archaeon]MEB3692529.1 HAD family phosphatase [Caldisphaeraceae archaeon]MEB3798343.1 HAD family phosphatase [Caldisphaeraceae archaeon]